MMKDRRSLSFSATTRGHADEHKDWNNPPIPSLLIRTRKQRKERICDLLLQNRLFFRLLCVLTIGPDNHWPVQVRLRPEFVRDKFNLRT